MQENRNETRRDVCQTDARARGVLCGQLNPCDEARARASADHVAILDHKERCGLMQFNRKNYMVAAKVRRNMLRLLKQSGQLGARVSTTNRIEWNEL